MNILIENSNIILTEVSCFDLEKTLECGQAFRWNKNPDGSYTGVASCHALTVKQTEDTLCFYNITKEEFDDFWFDYFDLGRDYENIEKKLSVDSVMCCAIKYGTGIRLLKQDLWETIISFIISASNNIPRIKKIIEALCKNFGSEILYNGNVYYSFPAPEQLKKVTLADIGIIRAGFRDKYIVETARRVNAREFLLETFSGLNNNDAKKYLLSLYGVGNKVADCIMLFGLQRYNAFPVDVWIKRVMEHFYFDDKQKISNVQAFAKEKFGELGGFAQQYLFYYARENKID